MTKGKRPVLEDFGVAAVALSTVTWYLAEVYAAAFWMRQYGTGAVILPLLIAFCVQIAAAIVEVKVARAVAERGTSTYAGYDPKRQGFIERYFVLFLPVVPICLTLVFVGGMLYLGLTALLRRAPSYPRLWDLTGMILTARVRREVWFYVIEEDKADYHDAMRRYRTRGARAWIRFCFAVRTVVRVGQTLYAVGGDRLYALVATLLRTLAGRWRQAK